MRAQTAVCVMLFMLFCSVSAKAASAKHVYNSGVVSSFGNNQISIDNGTYSLRPDVTVVLIVREGNGAHYRRPGRLSDLSTGKRVHLKSRGSMVYEIEVER